MLREDLSYSRYGNIQGSECDQTEPSPQRSSSASPRKLKESGSDIRLTGNVHLPKQGHKSPSLVVKATEQKDPVVKTDVNEEKEIKDGNSSPRDPHKAVASTHLYDGPIVIREVKPKVIKSSGTSVIGDEFCRCKSCVSKWENLHLPKKGRKSQRLVVKATKQNDSVIKINVKAEEGIKDGNSSPRDPHKAVASTHLYDGPIIEEVVTESSSSSESEDEDTVKVRKQTAARGRPLVPLSDPLSDDRLPAPSFPTRQFGDGGPVERVLADIAYQIRRLIRFTRRKWRKTRIVCGCDNVD
ncbi:uncharacterized protein LOC117345151 [Pecten maximus]|uniref:uncharacterized protein LOC117345151 n=1 Tax=Pecten maximus TaxID=6579 RepID=UPI001458DA9C|nr:uncharacterized protein LOC117345151 [Pecten maximus]